MRKPVWYFVAVLTAACWLTTGVWFAVGQSNATVSTDQKMYSVGEGMVISGKGFSPNAQINVSVQRPDQLVDYISGVISDANGAFSANYAPPYEPGRYRITATDGVNTAIAATTEADAIGYNKGVYDKNDTTYAGGAGHWTTGNAGGNYLEAQWAFYQYEFTGVGTTIPTADVAYNHFQSNTSAVFVDGFANFRACLDCTDNTNLSGPNKGMLLDGVFAPPTLTTNWADAHTAITLINHPFDSTNTCTNAIDPVNTPSDSHCFHIDGGALKTLINAAMNAKNGTQNVDSFATGTHTVTLYYAAHLAATRTWSKDKEYLLGCTGDPNYVIDSGQGQGAEFIPANTVFGTNVYNSTAGPCGLDANSWNSSSFFGIGSATGSSRHFSLENQSLGSQGGIDLPIPSVPAPTGSITIVKVTNPATAAGASFNFSGDLGGFALDTDPGTATPSSITFSGLSGGVTYNVAESSLPPGWQNSNLVCVNDSGTSTFTFNLSLTGSSVAIALPTTSGAAVTCTFTNIAQATLQLVKDVSNTNGGTATASQWTLSANGPTPISGAGGVGPSVVTPGSYSLSETGSVAGYTNGSTYSCVTTPLGGSAGSPVSSNSISLAAGDSAVCTITNHDNPAHLALVKNVSNTNGGRATASQWTLSASGPTPLSGAGGVASTPVGAGSYSLSESGTVAGYTNGTTYSCTGTRADSSAINLTGVTSISLGVGDSATCTIVNSDAPAHLALVKNVVSTNGGSATASQWTLTATGPTPLSGAGGVASTPVGAGSYSLAESGTVAGYTNGTTYSCTGTRADSSAISLTGVSSISLGVGDSASCTITNHDNPAHLALVKNVSNTNGGTATASQWTLSASGPTPLSGAGGVASTPVGAGSYSLSESGTVAGYTNGTTYSCTGTKADSSAISLTGVTSISLGVGDSASCTITNHDNPAHLALVKSVSNTNGGSATASQWTLSASGPTPLSGAGGVASTPVGAGSYSLAESGTVAGYTNGTTYSCTGTRADSSAINLSGVTSILLGVGDSATCTITNHDNPAQLTLVKDVQNNFGGTAAASNWVLTASGPTPLSGAGGVSSNVLAGAYTLGETGAVVGYTNGTAYSCVKTPAGGSALPPVAGNSITLGVGDSAVCAITNHDNPATIILVKNTTSGDGTFPFDIGGTVPSQQSVTTSGGTGMVSVTSLPTGNYTVSEQTPAGWTLTDLVCTVTGTQTVIGAATQFNQQNIPTQWGFTLPLGGSVTCTAVNSAPLTTRTQGFWATHTGLANAVWTGVNLPSGATQVAGSGDDLLCTANPITAIALPGQNELMGGFWSNISQTSANNKRSQLDQARMQMLQQYLAAVLNVHMFGSGSEAMLATARAAYCGNNVSSIKQQVGVLGTFNTSGDSGVFTPGASATAQASKSQANIPFWDVTFE